MKNEIISDIINLVNQQIDLYYRFYGKEPKYLKINKELYSLLEWNSEQVINKEKYLEGANINTVPTFMGLRILGTEKKDIEVF